VHHVGILYDQFMMHGQRNIKKINNQKTSSNYWKFQKLFVWRLAFLLTRMIRF